MTKISAQIPTLTEDFLRRYDVPGPRYTSYPPAPHFKGGWAESDLTDLLRRSNATGTPNLSFYVHIPFCPKQCLFCGCTTEIGKPGPEIRRYAQALGAEMDLVLPLLHTERPLKQIHFGGGTPNAVPFSVLADVLLRLRDRFVWAPDAEIAIECDPNLLSERKLAELRELGFNRISFGLQDFDRSVLEAVNRDFPRIEPKRMIQMAHELGFRGVNLDLIYGLPKQTPESFADSVRQAIEAGPDRVATFSYAHVPWAKDHQKSLESKGLPEADAKMRMAVGTYAAFAAAGYEPIGMDHYALPDDELAVASREGRLHRNFQGYCSRRTTGQVVSFGASAISQLHEGYLQNVKESSQYIDLVTAGRLPVERAYVLSRQERLHRRVINSVMCDGLLDLVEVGEEEGYAEAEVRQILAEGIQGLQPFLKDGLADFDGNKLVVTTQGRLAVRNIAMLFDPLLEKGAARYSRTV